MSNQINNQKKNLDNHHNRSAGTSSDSPRDNPRLVKWGINNDYAPLSDVLLGTPEYYRWVEASSAMTPWGALICHMQLKVRRADYVTAIEFYQQNNIPIWQYATAGHFEGGDFVIIEPGKVLIGYCGERSEKNGSEQVAEFVRAEGWEALTVPISREFVHMDGLVVPLDDKLLVACVDALEPWVVAKLKDWGFSFVDVPYREAKDLGVNLVALGNRKVLSMQGATELNANMRALGYEVYDPDMSMFKLGGGGVHCLCQALRRDDVAC